jgi:hypothetical protein
MSVRRSTGLPRACSGDMYVGVPRTSPSSVIRKLSDSEVDVPSVPDFGRIGLASPKSRSLTTPSGVMRTLAGFRSRWTTPASCATSSPSAI